MRSKRNVTDSRRMGPAGARGSHTHVSDVACGLLKGTAAKELHPRNSQGPVRPHSSEAGCPGGAFTHLLVRVHLTQESTLSLPKTTYGRNFPVPKLLSKPSDLQVTASCFSPTGYGSYQPGSPGHGLPTGHGFLHRAKGSGLPYSHLGLTHGLLEDRVLASACQRPPKRTGQKPTERIPQEKR